MTKHDKELLNELLRQKLSPFIERAFQTLNPGKKFLPGRHINALAYELEQVESGAITRSLITVPPRHLKSISATVAFPAWALGRNPTLEIIAASYNAELSTRHSLDTRRVMEDKWYRQTFPDLGFDPKKSTATEIRTTKNGGRYSTSIGGTLTGLGASLIIIDDPLKAEDAQSETARRRANEWFSTTLQSRLNNPETDAIIIVAQRLHVDDLVGHVQELGDWHHLNLPAIAEERQYIPVDNGANWKREKGDVLHPERLSKSKLEEYRVSMGSAHFEAQYQQNPQMPEGHLFKKKWFERYDELPGSFEAKIQSWDTALEVGAGHSYSVCTTWGISGKQLFLLDVFRDRLIFPDLKRKAIDLLEKFKPNGIIIEKAANGRDLARELREHVGYELRYLIQCLTPRGDKQVRAAAQSAKIESGLVVLPNEAAWVDCFIKEITGFPWGTHNDQVDSMVQFLKSLDLKGWAPYRNLSMNAVNPGSVRVTRVAPCEY